MDTLYNLALDFERKRQFNKAEAVFRYMGGHNPKFRDLEQKLTRAKAMAETVILGGSPGRTNASTLMLDGGTVEKPMLGRYRVEKELGKGAMGVVYLGKDPKIGRVVAIKTMALSQEFEPDGQSDLFSLGVTLYQLCCGGLPFTGESMAQLMFKIANEQPIDPVSLNPALPDCLVAVIQKALAKNKAERYRTGEEMARAIRECATELSAVEVSL